MKSNIIVGLSILLATSPCLATEKILTQSELQNINATNALYVKEIKEREAWNKSLADRAQRWGYNHAFATVLKEMKTQIMSRAAQYDQTLSFEKISSLVQTGTAKGMYLIGGVVDEIDASTELVDTNTIALHDKAYRIVKLPYLSPSKPNWRDYLFKKQNLDLEEVPKELLPKTDVERKLWKEHVDLGWERGKAAGYKEIQVRWQNLYADLIGMTRYWTAVELNVIDEAQLSITRLPVERSVYGEDNNLQEELRLNPTVIQIQSQSTFNPHIQDWNAMATPNNSDARTDVRDALITGDLYMEEVSDAQIIIETPDYQTMQENIRSDHPFRK